MFRSSVAAFYALRSPRLYRRVPQQELNLLQRSSAVMTQLRMDREHRIGHGDVHHRHVTPSLFLGLAELIGLHGERRAARRRSPRKRRTTPWTTVAAQMAVSIWVRSQPCPR